MEIYTLFFDGSCWPNPGGKAGIGFTLKHNDELIGSGSGLIGEGPSMSNNVAEYDALCKGLTIFKLNNCKGQLNIYGDSDLVIKQLNGLWKIKNGLYVEKAKKARLLIKEIRKNGSIVTLTWIPRAMNQSCDDLSKSHLENVDDI